MLDWVQLRLFVLVVFLYSLRLVSQVVTAQLYNKQSYGASNYKIMQFPDLSNRKIRFKILVVRFKKSNILFGLSNHHAYLLR